MSNETIVAVAVTYIFMWIFPKYDARRFKNLGIFLKQLFNEMEGNSGGYLPAR